MILFGKKIDGIDKRSILAYNILKYIKSDERKSSSWDSIRDRMSPAESILYLNVREVHPGAGLVKQI